MRSPFGNSTQTAKEIGGHFSPDSDKIVRPRPIKGVCAAIWPDKTDAHVAAVCDCSVRTAARYLSDEIDAPAVLFAAILGELTKKRRS